MEFVSENLFMTQKMCYKVVDTYPFTIEFVSECLMTRGTCDKAVNRCYFVFYFISYRYKIQ